MVVDDLLLASNVGDLIESFKSFLTQCLNAKLYGDISSFIPWELHRTDVGIKVTQSQYATRLLQRFGMEGCNTVNTPLTKNADLRPLLDDEEPLVVNAHHLYRSIVGGLAYIESCTRPDLSLSVSKLARNMHRPGQRHVQHGKRILRYLGGTLQHGIFFYEGTPVFAGSLQ